MGASLEVFAVSVERLKQIVGSKDEAVLEAILDGQSDFLSDIDELDEDAEVTAAEALANIVRGEDPGDEDPEYLYAYALQALCWHVGQELPNICPIAGASKWITKDVDPAMEKAGIPLRLSDLVFRGSPVEMPDVDDPAIGVWRAEEIAPALAAFRALDLNLVGGDLPKTFQQMRDWLEEANKTPGTSLIGFLV